MEKRLKKVYYNPRCPGSLGGVVRLRKQSKVSKKVIKNWICGEDAYTLHKSVSKGQRRATIVSGIRVQYQCDLMDTQNIKRENDMNSFVLICIDIFSKMGYARPLKNKTSSSIIPALRSILDEAGKCQQIQTDKGSEFLNEKVQKFLRQEGIKHFTSQNEDIKCAVVERFIRTIRDRLGRYFTYSNSKRYIDVLQDIIFSYNHSYHRSIKMRPADVNTQNSHTVWQNLYGHIKSNKNPSSIQPGDQVRIANPKKVFKKGYLPKWSEEIFTVSRVLQTIPYTYVLKDFHGDEIKGGWYAFEIQKVAKKDTFLIEEILGERKRKGSEKEVLIKWKGYSNNFNSWIPKSFVKTYT